MGLNGFNDISGMGCDVDLRAEQVRTLTNTGEVDRMRVIARLLEKRQCPGPAPSPVPCAVNEYKHRIVVG